MIKVGNVALPLAVPDLVTVAPPTSPRAGRGRTETDPDRAQRGGRRALREHGCSAAGKCDRCDLVAAGGDRTVRLSYSDEGRRGIRSAELQSVNRPVVRADRQQAGLVVILGPRHGAG